MRVSATEVKQILDTALIDSVVNVFINAANLTITEILGSDTTLSDSQLKEIERWFSAHLIACTRERQPQQEGAKDASITYQGQTGKGLDASLYGQQVKLLDTTGKLAAFLGKKQASLYAITSFD